MNTDNISVTTVDNKIIEPNQQHLFSRFKGEVSDVFNRLNNKIQDLEKESSNYSKNKEIYSRYSNEKSKGIDNTVVSFDVGGTIFEIPKITLEKYKASLLYEIFEISLKSSLGSGNDIFIDRSPELFKHVLTFIRYGTINELSLKKELLYLDFIDEMKYYRLLEYYPDYAKKFSISDESTASVVGIICNCTHDKIGLNFNTLTSNAKLDKAIITKWKGNLIFELDNIYTLNYIEAGGYKGDRDWNSVNGWGAGNPIYSSVDLSTWECVGAVPIFQSGIKGEFFFKDIKAKYIKIEVSDYLAIGYLDFSKKERV